MDGNKQVCFGVVGYFGTAVQGDKNIVFACIDHPCITTVVLYHPSQFQGYIEIDILFPSCPANCSRVIPPVSGVNDNGKSFAVLSQQMDWE